MVDYLESLERLAMPDELHIKECEKLGIGVTEDFDIVEQALLELKAIKEANPSEALECLEKVYSRLPQWDLSRNIDQCNIIKQALLKAQKERKALEIIKEKNVNIYQIKYMETLDDYNSVRGEEDRLTQEEFDLLKEVLGWAD